MMVLLALTWRVSKPQSESILTAYERPGDLVRFAIGLAVCAWILAHVFIPPRDATGYRTWVYLGLVAVPFIVLLAISVW